METYLPIPSFVSPEQKKDLPKNKYTSSSNRKQKKVISSGKNHSNSIPTDATHSQVKVPSPIQLDQLEQSALEKPTPAATTLPQLLGCMNQLMRELDGNSQQHLRQAIFHLGKLLVIEDICKKEVLPEDRLNLLAALIAHAAWVLEQLYRIEQPLDLTQQDSIPTHNLKALHHSIFPGRAYPAAVKAFYLGNHWPRFYLQLHPEFQKFSTMPNIEEPLALKKLIEVAENPQSLTPGAFRKYIRESLLSVLEAANFLLAKRNPSLPQEVPSFHLYNEPCAIADSTLKSLSQLLQSLNEKVKELPYSPDYQATLMLRQSISSLHMLESTLRIMENTLTCEGFVFCIQRALFLAQEATERALQSLLYLKEGDSRFISCHELRTLSTALKLNLGKLEEMFEKASHKTRYPFQTDSQACVSTLLDEAETLRYYPELDEGFENSSPADGLWKLSNKSRLTRIELTSNLERVLTEVFTAFQDKILRQIP